MEVWGTASRRRLFQMKMFVTVVIIAATVIARIGRQRVGQRVRLLQTSGPLDIARTFGRKLPDENPTLNATQAANINHSHPKNG